MGLRNFFCKTSKVITQKFKRLKIVPNIAKDVEYIVDCDCIDRKDRLILCCFWAGLDGEEKGEDYQKFREKFCIRKHEDWCLYHKPIKRDYYTDVKDEKWEKFINNPREGVKNLGKAVHDECHHALELTQNRLIGAIMEAQKEISIKTKEEHVKRQEIFRRHYHEFGCLKASFISEINLRENKKSAHFNIAIFSFSSIIAIEIARFTTKDLQPTISHAFWALEIMFLLALVIGVFLYLRESIKYNEAKDAFYICVGVDVDNRKRTT